MRLFCCGTGARVKWNETLKYLPTLSECLLFVAATVMAACVGWLLARAGISSINVAFLQRYPLPLFVLSAAAMVLAWIFVSRRNERTWFGPLLVPLGAVGSGYMLGQIILAPISLPADLFAAYLVLFFTTSVASLPTKLPKRDLPEAAKDAFDRSILASEIARKINQVYTEGRSTVVAVEGPWGSGKTTVMGMLGRELEETWSSVWFNPLSFRTQDLAWQQLSTQIRAEIDPVGEASRNFLAVGGKALSDLTRLLGVRSDFTSLLTSAMPVDTIPEMRSYIRHRLGKRRLVIFIDDMDRLPSDRAFDVLTVTMQHLRSLDCLVVLGIDRERTLLHLSRILQSEGHDHDSQTFIDKLVDLRYPLAAPSNWQRREYLRDRLELSKTYLAEYHPPGASRAKGI